MYTVTISWVKSIGFQVIVSTRSLSTEGQNNYCKTLELSSLSLKASKVPSVGVIFPQTWGPLKHTGPENSASVSQQKITGCFSCKGKYN